MCCGIGPGTLIFMGYALIGHLLDRQFEAPSSVDLLSINFINHYDQQPLFRVVIKHVFFVPDL